MEFFKNLFGLSGRSARLGIAKISYPKGWREIRDGDERVLIVSPDEYHQLTFSMMQFDSAPAFRQFESICEARLRAEEMSGADIFATEDCFRDSGTYGMFYSGRTETGAWCSAYLGLQSTQLITIYLESASESPEHLRLFQDYVSGLKWD